MDRAALRQRFREAKRRVQRVQRRIVHQRDIVSTLEWDGHDATAAKEFLRGLQSTLARLVADRDQRVKELLD
jgi:hypothetical protein